MKKILTLFAMGAIVCGMSSCSSDAPEKVVEQEATIDCTLIAPGMETRAFGDGATVDQLRYLVFDDNGKVIFNVAKDAFAGAETTDKVSFSLITGKAYTLVFWAEKKGNQYYTLNEDGTLDVDYTIAPANDETRDAFFAAERFTVTKDVSKSFYLTRPFAQINIGTTVEDYVAAVTAKSEILKTGLKIKTYSRINLVTGEVSNPTSSEIKFTEAPVPNSLLGLTPSTDLKVKLDADTNAEYVWLSMNYVLCGVEKEIINVLTLTTDGVTADKPYGSVPMQRNYRTNIIGNLLTSNYNYDVVLMPNFSTTENNVVR